MAEKDKSTPNDQSSPSDHSIDRFRRIHAAVSCTPSLMNTISRTFDCGCGNGGLCWQRRDNTFRMNLRDKGFRVQPVTGDGSCLFRAVALQLFGDENLHNDVRQKALDYIAANKDDYRHFITEDIDKYIDRLRTPGEWSDHIEIQGVSMAFDRTIEIYSYGLEPVQVINPEASSTDSTQILRLAYMRGIHYDAIFPYIRAENTISQNAKESDSFAGCQCHRPSHGSCNVSVGAFDNNRIAEELSRGNTNALDVAKDPDTPRPSIKIYSGENIDIPPPKPVMDSAVRLTEENKTIGVLKSSPNRRVLKTPSPPKTGKAYKVLPIRKQNLGKHSVEKAKSGHKASGEKSARRIRSYDKGEKKAKRAPKRQLDKEEKQHSPRKRPRRE